MGNDGHENKVTENIIAICVDLACCGSVERCNGEGESADQLLVAEGCDEGFKEGSKCLDM